MNILFFVHHEPSWGSSKERIGAYLPFLDKRGHRYKIFYVAPNSLRQIILGKTSYSFFKRFFYSTLHNRVLRLIKFIWIIFKAKNFDLIVIQKVTLPKVLIKILRKRNNNIIFDFDDLCFLLPSLNYKNSFQKLHLQWNFISYPAILKEFKHIIAGNSYLADLARSYVENSKITILSTPIDCTMYAPPCKRKVENDFSLPIIGWIGSGENHLEHLKLLISPFNQVVQKIPFKFVLIGSLYSEKIKNIFQSPYYSFQAIEWLNAQELVQMIQTFDVGVMPLVDSEEAKAKCGFKALAYMACGVASIVSPVGVNSIIVQDGINGLWAQNEAEWISKLSLLLKNKTLRTQLGREGRKKVEQKYSLEKNSKTFIEVLEKNAL